jgi:hypothetical protein
VRDSNSVLESTVAHKVVLTKQARLFGSTGLPARSGDIYSSELWSVSLPERDVIRRLTLAGIMTQRIEFHSRPQTLWIRRVHFNK